VLIAGAFRLAVLFSFEPIDPAALSFMFPALDAVTRFGVDWRIVLSAVIVAIGMLYNMVPISCFVPVEPVAADVAQDREPLEQAFKLF
jgi:hypothetical protein